MLEEYSESPTDMAPPMWNNVKEEMKLFYNYNNRKVMSKGFSLKIISKSYFNFSVTELRSMIVIQVILNVILLYEDVQFLAFL